MKLRVLFTCFLASLSLAAHAQMDPKGFREHHELRDSKDHVVYTVTNIVSLSDIEDEHLFLVLDTEGNRFLFSNIRDYMDQTTVYEIKDLTSKESVRSTMQFNFKSKTRAQTIAEFRDPTYKPDDPPITVEAGGVVRTAKASEWQDRQTSTNYISEARRAMAPQFLESLELMRGRLFGVQMLDTFCQGLMQMIMHRESCEQDADVKEVEIHADCDFDSRFGFPCSDKQKQRLAEAVEKNQPVSHY